MLLIWWHCNLFLILWCRRSGCNFDFFCTSVIRTCLCWYSIHWCIRLIGIWILLLQLLILLLHRLLQHFHLLLEILNDLLIVASFADPLALVAAAVL